MQTPESTGIGKEKFKVCWTLSSNSESSKKIFKSTLKVWFRPNTVGNFKPAHLYRYCCLKLQPTSLYTQLTIVKASRIGGYVLYWVPIISNFKVYILQIKQLLNLLHLADTLVPWRVRDNWRSPRCVSSFPQPPLPTSNFIRSVTVREVMDSPTEGQCC